MTETTLEKQNTKDRSDKDAKLEKIRKEIDRLAELNPSVGLEKFGQIGNQKKLLQSLESFELFNNLKEIAKTGIVTMSVIEKQGAEILLQEIIDRLSSKEKMFNIDDLQHLTKTIANFPKNHPKVIRINSLLTDRLTVKKSSTFKGNLCDLTSYLKKEV